MPNFFIHQLQQKKETEAAKKGDKSKQKSEQRLMDMSDMMSDMMSDNLDSVTLDDIADVSGKRTNKTGTKSPPSHVNRDNGSWKRVQMPSRRSFDRKGEEKKDKMQPESEQQKNVTIAPTPTPADSTFHTTHGLSPVPQSGQSMTSLSGHVSPAGTSPGAISEYSGEVSQARTSTRATPDSMAADHSFPHNQPYLDSSGSVGATHATPEGRSSPHVQPKSGYGSKGSNQLSSLNSPTIKDRSASSSGFPGTPRKRMKSIIKATPSFEDKVPYHSGEKTSNRDLSSSSHAGLSPSPAASKLTTPPKDQRFPYNRLQNITSPSKLSAADFYASRGSSYTYPYGSGYTKQPETSNGLGKASSPNRWARHEGIPPSEYQSIQNSPKYTRAPSRTDSRNRDMHYKATGGKPFETLAHKEQKQPASENRPANAYPVQNQKDPRSDLTSQLKRRKNRLALKRKRQPICSDCKRSLRSRTLQGSAFGQEWSMKRPVDSLCLLNNYAMSWFVYLLPYLSSLVHIVQLVKLLALRLLFILLISTFIGCLKEQAMSKIGSIYDPNETATEVSKMQRPSDL